MCGAVWPKARANPLTDSGPNGMPCATSAFRMAMWRAFRMKDPVSLVSAGVLPKTGSPDNAAAPMPCGTATFAFRCGRAVELAGPAAMNSSRVPAVPAASAAPARLGLAQSDGFNAGFLLGRHVSDSGPGDQKMTAMQPPAADRMLSQPEVASQEEPAGSSANAAAGCKGARSAH